MGIRRFHRHNVLLKYVALLSLIPILMVSVSYALFSQQLSVNATGSSVSYVSSQYTLMTYTKTATYASNTYTYSFSPVTIKNNGVTSITAWQFTYVVPADATTLTCQSTVTCTKRGTTVTVKNGTGNGTLAKGASTTFTMSFKTATALYTLQSVAISATFSTAYQSITGLTVGIVVGTSTRSGSTYTWKPTITVTNNSGQPLSGWRLVITPWASTSAVTSTMPTGITYATTSSRVTFTSTNALAAGATYQFIPTITNRTSSWAAAGVLTGRA